ncbi:OLC1v1011199C1 [Oldenlandia corymbosa var. corymbosa]|uniref:OLC1v1011199C1 n=1 Tax=Oldenlandia corymbosa var. corymbosa TaxID=529605 RepID=A0AAV1DTQ9_OLDCO|nr:OLC1v1011199C1 [Oldenlandia corymbosa var. corymbosa]
MSDSASESLNVHSESEKNNECSTNGSIKPQIEQKGETVAKSGSEVPCSVVENPTSVNGAANSVPEVGSSEVEYIESDHLNDLEDVDLSLKTLLTGLDSKDWVLVCEALNKVRRLCIFHKDAMLDILDNVISLVVKSLKNPRSAVCKTALMTCADIFKAYRDDLIDLLDPMLVQLLLKSSQDKKFVCEAAEKALISMTTWISPVSLLPKLQPYLKNRNPRIRAKAAMCFSRSAPKLGVDGIKAYGIDKLIEIAISQLSGQLPESREAARTLLLELQTVYEKSHAPNADDVSDGPDTTSWEDFCQSKLSPLNAQAVLRVTSIVREGVVGS